MYWTMQATDSASLIGILMMASALPAVILTPVGGTFADWYSRRMIIVVSDLLSGLSVITLAVLFFLERSDFSLVIGLFSVFVLLSTIKAFFQPAIMAAIPDLVPLDKVAAANSLTHFSTQASTLLGQGLGGVLYRLLGPGLLFLADGLTYIVSAVSEAFIDIPEVARPKKVNFRQALRNFKLDTQEGIRYVWKRKGMSSLLLLSSVINFLLMPVFVLLPFYVELNLTGGAEWYGFLLAAMSAGAVAGFMIAGLLQVNGRTRARLIISAFFGVSVALAGMSLVTDRYIALVVLFLVGIFSGLINIYVITIFQTQTPTELRGRVMSLVIALSGGIAPLGMMLGGLLGDLTDKNIPVIYGIGGGLAAAATLIAALSKEFRMFLALEPVDVEQPLSASEG